MHPATRCGGHGRIAPPGLLVRWQIVAQEVSLLRDDRADGFVLQPAPVRIARRRFGEQKAVVRCDHHIVAVQIVDDIEDKLSQFLDRLPDSLEGVPFGGGLVAPSVNLVMVDVDETLAGNELPTVFLLQCE